MWLKKIFRAVLIAAVALSLSVGIQTSVGCAPSKATVKQEESLHQVRIENKTFFYCHFGLGIINQEFEYAGKIVPGGVFEAINFHTGDWILVWQCFRDDTLDHEVDPVSFQTFSVTEDSMAEYERFNDGYSLKVEIVPKDKL